MFQVRPDLRRLRRAAQQICQRGQRPALAHQVGVQVHAFAEPVVLSQPRPGAVIVVVHPGVLRLMPDGETGPPHIEAPAPAEIEAFQPLENILRQPDRAPVLLPHDEQGHLGQEGFEHDVVLEVHTARGVERARHEPVLLLQGEEEFEAVARVVHGVAAVPEQDRLKVLVPVVQSLVRIPGEVGRMRGRMADPLRQQRQQRGEVVRLLFGQQFGLRKRGDVVFHKNISWHRSPSRRPPQGAPDSHCRIARILRRI